MTSVWLIETGDYSSYAVLGVAATEDEANAIVERANRLLNKPTYGQWYCSERRMVTADELVMSWVWHLRGDGTPYASDHDARISDPKYADVRFAHEMGVTNHNHPDDSGSGEWFHVQATTQEQADKIAHDWMAQRAAEEAGLT